MLLAMAYTAIVCIVRFLELTVGSLGLKAHENSGESKKRFKKSSYIQESI